MFTLANKGQKVQDWLTQQWNIFYGQKIDPVDYKWLIGPIGNSSSDEYGYINYLIEKENLLIQKQEQKSGILNSLTQLNLHENELNRLHKEIREFYEYTFNYNLFLTVKWTWCFKIFAMVIKILFSNRLKQLNIPINSCKNELLKSEIFSLKDKVSNEIKYTYWVRKIESTNTTIFSGVYDIGNLPDKSTCIKAVFPLPMGNATVFMKPNVTVDGNLELSSSGENIGDSGFYFILLDSEENYWTHYIKTFEDKLTFSHFEGKLKATQTFTLWKLKVVELEYNIELKHPLSPSK